MFDGDSCEMWYSSDFRTYGFKSILIDRWLVLSFVKVGLVWLRAIVTGLVDDIPTLDDKDWVVVEF